MKKHAQSLVFSSAVVAPALLNTGCAEDPHHRSTGQYVDEWSVSTRVKSAMLADKMVNGTDVKVQTYGGVVQLCGFVDSEMTSS
jgi:hyperosmotically inducible protein